jgi:deoxyadenosine/deoxycytidine kinase
MIVAVESCPGGGKGFFLKHLSTYLHNLGITDFSTQLLDDNISHMLDYSKDQNRWAAFNQFDFMLKHYKAARGPPDTLVLVEGSIASDFECIVPHVGAMFEPAEQDLIDGWHSLMTCKSPPPDAIIYLDADAHNHFERVVNNSKREQAYLSHASLRQLKSQFDAYIDRAAVPVLRLKCVSNFEDNEPTLNKMAEETLSFLRKVFKEKASCMVK